MGDIVFDKEAALRIMRHTVKIKTAAAPRIGSGGGRTSQMPMPGGGQTPGGSVPTEAALQALQAYTNTVGLPKPGATGAGAARRPVVAKTDASLLAKSGLPKGSVPPKNKTAMVLYGEHLEKTAGTHGRLLNWGLKLGPRAGAGLKRGGQALWSGQKWFRGKDSAWRAMRGTDTASLAAAQKAQANLTSKIQKGHSVKPPSSTDVTDKFTLPDYAKPKGPSTLGLNSSTAQNISNRTSGPVNVSTSTSKPVRPVVNAAAKPPPKANPTLVPPAEPPVANAGNVGKHYTEALRTSAANKSARDARQLLSEGGQPANMTPVAPAGFKPYTTVQQSLRQRLLGKPRRAGENVYTLDPKSKIKPPANAAPEIISQPTGKLDRLKKTVRPKGSAPDGYKLRPATPKTPAMPEAFDTKDITKLLPATPAKPKTPGGSWLTPGNAFNINPKYTAIRAAKGAATGAAIAAPLTFAPFGPGPAGMTQEAYIDEGGNRTTRDAPWLLGRLGKTQLTDPRRYAAMAGLGSEFAGWATPPLAAYNLATRASPRLGGPQLTGPNAKFKGAPNPSDAAYRYFSGLANTPPFKIEKGKFVDAQGKPFQPSPGSINDQDLLWRLRNPQPKTPGGRLTNEQTARRAEAIEQQQRIDAAAKGKK